MVPRCCFSSTCQHREHTICHDPPQGYFISVVHDLKYCPSEGFPVAKFTLGQALSRGVGMRSGNIRVVYIHRHSDNPINS